MKYQKVKLNIPENLVHEFSIDTEGIVRNETNGRTLKGTSITKKNRYKKIHLAKFYALHRLVAEHFIPNPKELPYINHINGDREDNRAENLEWCDHRSNIMHAWDLGIKSQAKLTPELAKKVYKLGLQGMQAATIKDVLCLEAHQSTIKDVINERSWCRHTVGMCV